MHFCISQNKQVGYCKLGILYWFLGSAQYCYMYTLPSFKPQSNSNRYNTHEIIETGLYIGGKVWSLITVGGQGAKLLSQLDS